MTASFVPGEAKGRQLIVFRAGGQEFCVDIASVREIRSWSAATPLPQSPPYVRGVINLRGTVLPIVDMAVRLGLPSSESDRQVIIVVWIDNQLVGLLVDAVSDILDAPDEAFQPTPEMACDTVHAFVSRLLTLEERLVGLIALDHVLPPQVRAA